MNDGTHHRQNMHLALLQLLELPEHFPVWKERSPRAFSAKVADFRRAVEAFGLRIDQHQDGMADKDHEPFGLEVLACEIGQALACWLESKGRNTDAVRIDCPLVHWLKLNDSDLIGKARLLRKLLIEALATDGDSLSDYDLTADDAIALAMGIIDFEAGIVSTESDISGPGTLASPLRSLCREVSEILTGLDRLVLRFRHTKHGRCFVGAWQSARKMPVSALQGHGDEVSAPACSVT